MKAQNQPPFLFPDSGQAPEAEIRWFYSRARMVCGGLCGTEQQCRSWALGEKRSRRQEKAGPAQNNLTLFLNFLLY